METGSLEFLRRLIETPSPSGYESQILQVIREYISPYADEIRTDVQGNCIVVKNPAGPLRVMLAGHCDQIGLSVQHIDEDGYLYVISIGGWDVPILLGQQVTVWTESGPVRGVIGRKPIHLLDEEERKKVPKLKEIWVDIGAANKEEAAQLVRIGDPVTVELSFRVLRNERAVGPGMDDKCGAWVVMEALRRVDPKKLQVALYAVATVQEEVGLRGAVTSTFGIEPQVGLAVDVTHATDCPTVEKKEEGDIRLGKGPVIYRGPNFHPKVVRLLMETAQACGIPYQMGASGRPPGTDAAVIQISRTGVATGLVSIPNRYMHTPVEMVSLSDLDHGANLLARFVESLEPSMSFTW
ncbi:MAG: M42 family metallopeptidase [Thermoguttaceae bacterium]|nr:M42 family metallopeptidase [Thermoguttaceae bacterium]MDW8037559.1 M42 family metallopeptidase [Thermoguttaceae bacterium]